MTLAVPDILARIVEQKRTELAGIRSRLSKLEAMAEERRSERRDFSAALKLRNPAIIAEIKKASPSKGVLSQDFDPPAIAADYEAGGAAALSVLTDTRFFQGRLDHLQAARHAVSLPVLRKDFTIDSCQVIEAAAHGADAILLIAAVLPPVEMRNLRELASRWGMAALVEVHDEEELESALDSGAEILGVNNRNLHTFQVQLATSLRLADRIPSHVLRVSESGIHSRADIRLLQNSGYTGFLIGEYLMRSGWPREALGELLA